MGELTDPCEYCDAPTGEFAFVEYQADPNDLQEDTEWYENTPESVQALVCTGCGLLRSVVDPRGEDDLPDFDELDGVGGPSFRVDDELE